MAHHLHLRMSLRGKKRTGSS